MSSRPGALPFFSTLMPMSSSAAVNALVNPGSSGYRCRSRCTFGELLKHYQELYDADPFSEDTVEAGTNLNDHIKETTKLKWEEMITGIAFTHNSKKGWQTLSKINGDDRKPISSPNITPGTIAHQLLCSIGSLTKTVRYVTKRRY